MDSILRLSTDPGVWFQPQRTIQICLIAYRVVCIFCFSFHVGEGRERVRQFCALPFVTRHQENVLNLNKGSEQLYQFLVAAVTNYHKLGGLKQHSLVVLQFFMSEVWNTSHWAKTNMSSARLHYFLEAQGKICILAHFGFLAKFRLLWL